jgi:predicted enzyme related to lactoylglutathione lyase
LTVEFEHPDARTAALRDDGDFTVFLHQPDAPSPPGGVVLYFRVDDVEETFHALSAREVPFVHPPARRFWGYGAELSDPDGYLVRLWDERSMKAHGGS